MSEPARTTTFLVMTFLSIRGTPGLSGDRLARFLAAGTRLVVDADSRTVKDGFIWWQHKDGWSAEAALDGSKVYLKLISEDPAPSETTAPPAPESATPAASTETDAAPDALTQYEVLTNLSIRAQPSVSAERVGSEQLAAGDVITVDPDSRTEADGFVWWKHDAGWSAEKKLDGSATYLQPASKSAPAPAPEPEITSPEPITDGGKTPVTPTPAAEPKRFRVLTNLSIRAQPSVSAERVGSGQLAAGQLITVEPTSRTEADGFVWWQHKTGWSAEKKLDGSTTYLGPPDATVPGAIEFTADGLPDVDSLPQRDALVTRMPVDLANTQWVQYFGNTQFAFKNGARWNYDAFAQGLHSGFDFGNSFPAGVPVYAGVTGTFLRSDRYGIVIKSGEYVIIYQHLHRNTTYTPGGTVTPNTLMGEMKPGDNHLHFEIRYSAEKWIINPLLMMPAAMRDGLMRKFPTFARHFQPYTDWQTPMDQPVIVRGGPLIGPRAR